MRKILTLILFIVSCSFCWAQDPITEKNDTLSYLIGVNFGSFIKGNNFPAESIDYDVVWTGVSKFISAAGNPYDEDFALQFKYDPNTMTDVFNRAISNASKDIAVKNDTLSYLIGVNFGSFIKGNNFPEYKIDYDSVLDGILEFLSAKGPIDDKDFGLQFKYNPDIMNELFNRVITEAKEIKAKLNKELEVAFMNANSLKYGVVTTETGLQYKIIKPGNDQHVLSTDFVEVNYKGSFIDGTVFDEIESITFAVDKVISGWSEGITKVGKGGEIILYIPSHLAYGEKGNSGIEPNATLIFHVEVLSHWSEEEN